MNNTKTLHEIISKAYCINLYFRPDRWQAAGEQFAKHGLNVERFNAIDGKEFRKEYPMRPGNAGNLLSHFTIIHTAYIMGLDAILVFEDDPVFREGFTEKMNEFLAELPEDWDMIMLGASHRVKPSRITDKVYKVNKGLSAHAFILRSTLFEVFLERMKAFDTVFDCIFAEVQLTYNVYIPNPPLVWQTSGYSDLEGRNMNYDFLQTNDQV